MERWKVGRLISLGKRGRRWEGRKGGKVEGWKVDKFGNEGVEGWKEGRVERKIGKKEGWKVDKYWKEGLKSGRLEGRKEGWKVGLNLTLVLKSTIKTNRLIIFKSN